MEHKNDIVEADDIRMVQDFSTFASRHCETSATRSLLKCLDFDISEPMLLGLGQGLGFIYWKMSFMNLPFIGGRSKPFELTKVFCRNMGFELDERETTSKKKAWLNVAENIDSNIPVGLQLDCYHLEHFGNSFHFAGHFLSVYGYDSTSAFVFDTGRPYTVALENLEKARFEKGSMAAKARSYTIGKGKSLASFRDVIPKAVGEIAKEFLKPPIKCFGHEGIRKLGNEMSGWMESAPNPQKDLQEQADLMENGGTGGAIFRNFFRDFLYESLEYIPGNLNLEKAAGLYKQAALNWEEIARLVMKAGSSGESKHLEDASRICIRTADIEKEAMELLSSL